jgi:O-methyltransferase
VLKAYGDTERKVWVADSFQGLPKPDPERWPADADDTFWTVEQLAVSLDEVKANFERYGLLDDRVCFLAGWFKDTLPTAPIERLALLRLDGDMYGSTMDALEALYPKVSPGGYVIIDDYGAIQNCKEAVEDYRNAHRIIDPMEWVDWTGVWWQKSDD